MIARRRLRVAVIDEELPYPANSGKRIRTLNLLARLAERHAITIICHRNGDPSEANDAIAYLNGHGITTVVVDRTAPPRTAVQAGPLFYARLAANLFSPLPYLVTANCSSVLRQAVSRYARSVNVDLWHCEWTPLFQTIRHLCQAPRIVVAHNVESSLWQRYYDVEKRRVHRWYINQQKLKLATFERQAFTEAARVVAVSNCDAKRICSKFGTVDVQVVDNGVDTRYFVPGTDVRQNDHILFLGSLDWRPNLDAVKLLLSQVFPSVLRAEPAARLLLVGRNPPDWLRRAVAAAINVELHADVPDVRPFLQRASVMAIPLRIGGGSRLKILEALACELPVVSSSVGAEGLALRPYFDYFEADSTDDMAAVLVECLRNPTRAVGCARRGRQVVLDRYDWDGLANRLEQVWLSATGFAETENTENGCTASRPMSSEKLIETTVSSPAGLPPLSPETP